MSANKFDPFGVNAFETFHVGRPKFTRGPAQTTPGGFTLDGPLGLNISTAVEGVKRTDVMLCALCDAVALPERAPREGEQYICRACLFDKDVTPADVGLAQRLTGLILTRPNGPTFHETHPLRMFWQACLDCAWLTEAHAGHEAPPHTHHADFPLHRVRWQSVLLLVDETQPETADDARTPQQLASFIGDLFGDAP